MTLKSRLTSYFATCAAVAVLLLVFVTPMQAQGGPYSPGARDRVLADSYGRPLSDLERQRRLDGDMQNRGRMMNSGNGGFRNLPTGYFWNFGAIQKNTVRLRETNDSLQQAIAPSRTPDYRTIAKYASRIRDLTTSLRTQLYIPKAKTPTNQLESEPAMTVEQLRSSVQALDRQVELFLLNQAVQRPGVVNANLRAEAGEEARDLIAQSKRVKRLADTLRLTQPASRP